MEEPSVDLSKLKKLLGGLREVFPRTSGKNYEVGVLLAFVQEVLNNPEFKETAIAGKMLLLIISSIKEASPYLFANPTEIVSSITAGDTSIDEAVGELLSLIKDNVSSDLVPAKNLLWFMKQALSGERGSDFYASLGDAVSLIHTWMCKAEASAELLATAQEAAQLAEMLQVVVPQPPSIVPSSTPDDPGY